ncbi:hypothetical protein ACH42_02285 [Endozoicomonas sp. (ex Bugula neritina AB1)]|nr:hypothetical protein ACH42_02285 [Endozoicomonas sp. (ex Bugula neritina AB1)]
MIISTTAYPHQIFNLNAMATTPSFDITWLLADRLLLSKEKYTYFSPNENTVTAFPITPPNELIFSSGMENLSAISPDAPSSMDMDMEQELTLLEFLEEQNNLPQRLREEPVEETPCDYAQLFHENLRNNNRAQYEFLRMLIAQLIGEYFNILKSEKFSKDFQKFIQSILDFVFLVDPPESERQSLITADFFLGI